MHSTEQLQAEKRVLLGVLCRVQLAICPRMAASGCPRFWLDGRGTATTLEEANNIIIVKIKLHEFVSDHQNKLSPGFRRDWT